MDLDFLHQYFKDLHIVPFASGGTDAQLRLLTAEENQYILKSLPFNLPEESLSREHDMYAWLSGKVLVPQVKFFIVHNDVEYLCMSKVPGDTLESCIRKWKDEYVVVRYAEVLKHLHGLPLDGNVPHWSLTDRLRVAQVRLQERTIDEDDIDPQFKHLSLQELFDEMMKLVPGDLDEVCTHGDYCLDNLLVDGDALSGLIDMGRGGRGDRYQDLALAARSVQEAFGEKMLGLFFSSYGLNNPSEEKLRFYTMLDEFF